VPCFHFIHLFDPEIAPNDHSLIYELRGIQYGALETITIIQNTDFPIKTKNFGGFKVTKGDLVSC